jgi:hypothetical protein
MGGAFIISRDIFENPIWQNNIEFRLFFLILGKAVWKEEGVKVGDMIIQKGQWLRSYRNLQSDMEYAESNTIRKPGKATIQRAIARLIKEERITIKTVKSGTLFTVINYCKYQDFSHYKKGTRDTSKDSNGTATGQQRDKKKKEIKEIKEIKKDLKYTYAELVHLTSAEYNRLVNEFGEDFTKRCIEVLDGYKGANNKTYADDNRAIRNWVVKRVQEEQNTTNPKSKIPRGFQDIMNYGGKNDN